MAVQGSLSYDMMPVEQFVLAGIVVEHRVEGPLSVIQYSTATLQKVCVCVMCCVLRVACCVLRVACCVLCVVCCVLCVVLCCGALRSVVCVCVCACPAPCRIRQVKFASRSQAGSSVHSTIYRPTKTVVDVL